MNWEALGSVSEGRQTGKKLFGFFVSYSALISPI